MGSLRLSKVVGASVVVCVSILLLSPPTEVNGEWWGEYPIDQCHLWPLDKLFEKGTCRDRCLEKKRLYPEKHACIYDGYCNFPIGPSGLSGHLGGLIGLCMCRCHEK